MERRWVIAPPIDDALKTQFPDLDPVVLQLLYNRGRTTQALMDEFLMPDYSQDVHDPYLLRDMKKAIDRIVEAVEKKEKIMIFGDYDVDGVSSVSVLVWTFRDLHIPNVDVYLPDRYSEGYGLNIPAVEEFAKNGVSLLITCDCGTSNVAEIAKANELGIDVIVVDHHKKAPEVPKAFAILNPFFDEETYPEKKLCSTGIAFKLATALFQKLEYGKTLFEKPLPAGWEKWLLDLVAVATIADMMPILGENRTLVKHGLTVLKKSKRVGLKALSQVMGTPLEKISSGTIGFQIGPRLNAAGRLKHANAALQLLTTEDIPEALQLAQELNTTNTERQQVTQKLFAEALAQQPEGDVPALISAVGSGWPSGVVGLVAGRLKETFHRPALAIGRAGDKLVGSGRSVGSFDITAALVESKDYLEHFGGHPMACGFTLKSSDALEPFLASMRKIAERELTDLDRSPEQRIDALITLAQADWNLAETVERFDPFGLAAPEPIFATQNVQLSSLQRMGKDQKHLRLLLSENGATKKAVAFGFGEASAQWDPTLCYDVAYHVGVNEWNGNRELQLQIVDIRPSSTETQSPLQ